MNGYVNGRLLREDGWAEEQPINLVHVRDAVNVGEPEEGPACTVTMLWTDEQYKVALSAEEILNRQKKIFDDQEAPYGRRISRSVGD